jgi:hypothetical protein
MWAPVSLYLRALYFLPKLIIMKAQKFFFALFWVIFFAFVALYCSSCKATPPKKDFNESEFSKDFNLTPPDTTPVDTSKFLILRAFEIKTK